MTQVTTIHQCCMNCRNTPHNIKYHIQQQPVMCNKRKPIQQCHVDKNINFHCNETHFKRLSTSNVHGLQCLSGLGDWQSLTASSHGLLPVVHVTLLLCTFYYVKLLDGSIIHHCSPSTVTAGSIHI